MNREIDLDDLVNELFTSDNGKATATGREDSLMRRWLTKFEPLRDLLAGDVERGYTVVDKYKFIDELHFLYRKREITASFLREGGV